MINLSDILLLKEEKLSGELKRIKRLFISGFKTFLSGKSREVKLNFMENIIDSTITNKSDLKLFILRLQKSYHKPKKK